MRYTIRLLMLAILALFVVALWVADHGQRAQASFTPNSMRYPGLFEFFVLWGLLGLTLLLSLLLSACGIAQALKQRDAPWGITLAVLVLGIGALYLGLLVPPGVLLPLARRVLPTSSFLVLPLAFLPALLGSVVATGYSFHTSPDPHPPLHARWG